MTVLLALMVLRFAGVLVGGVIGIVLTAIGCLAELAGWGLRGMWWVTVRLAPHVARALTAVRHADTRPHPPRLGMHAALLQGTAAALGGRTRGR